MSEFGPALFILLIMIFFPLLDLVSMCVSYGSILFLNSCQTKQAALVPSLQAQDSSGSVKKQIVDEWKSQGMGAFVKVVGNIQTVVTYRKGEKDPQTQIEDKIVRVTTTVTCSPFITVPAPPILHIPGLSAPMTFTVSTEAPEENPDNAG